MYVCFFPAESFSLLACFSFSLQVLFWEPGLLRLILAVLGRGVIMLAMPTKPFSCSLPPSWQREWLSKGPSQGEDGGWAGILTHCWWEWKLEHPLRKAVWPNVPKVWKLFGTGRLHKELEKVAKKPKQPKIGDGLDMEGRKRCQVWPPGFFFKKLGR